MKTFKEILSEEDYDVELTEGKFTNLDNFEILAKIANGKEKEKVEGIVLKPETAGKLLKLANGLDTQSKNKIKKMPFSKFYRVFEAALTL